MQIALDLEQLLPALKPAFLSLRLYTEIIILIQKRNCFAETAASYRYEPVLVLKQKL